MWSAHLRASAWIVALGFTPAKLDGRMHTLQVSLAQGLVARARRSYLATAPR